MLTLLFLPYGSGTQSYSWEMIGGGISGGIAIWQQIANIDAVGGGIIGGVASIQQLIALSMIGGGLVGGYGDVLGTLGRSGGTSPNTIILNNGHLAKKITDTFYLIL